MYDLFTISLNGQWEYMVDPDGSYNAETLVGLNGPDAHWAQMTIPANWELAGLHNYSGVVWFRRTFVVPEDCRSMPHVSVRFSGVDYFTHAWLNGSLIGEHEGYFQRFEFAADEFVRKGGVNQLLVRVDAPREIPGEEWPNRKRLIKGVLSHHDARPGCWDLATGQDMGTGGIWNDVDLLFSGDIRIMSLNITPTLLWESGDGLSAPDGMARARVEVVNHLQVPLVCEARLELVGDADGEGEGDGEGDVVALESRRVLLSPGMNTLDLVCRVSRPDLWWVWDQGDPSLYRARVSLVAQGGSCSAEVLFGFRELTSDSSGHLFLNRRPIFIRGTNIIPTQWLSEYGRSMIDRDIELLRSANVNGIRVHAHVNRAELYDACDRSGILVWQDFALQWSYRETPDLVHSAVTQVREMVEGLYNHPSICIWCCHNEPSANRDSLDPILFEVVRSHDATRVVKPNSDFSEHPYYGWYYGSMDQFEHAPDGPIVSEYGAQALPDVESLAQMVGAEKLWPPDFAAWAYHDFQYDQTFNVARIGLGTSIEEFVANSQEYQARLLKLATESYRMAKFTKIASLFQFMFVDCWPAITWSVVDYGRKPKKGYWALARAFQPVLPCIVRERERMVAGLKLLKEIWVVNDLPHPHPDCVIEATLEDSAGLVREHKMYSVQVPPNQAARVYSVSPGADEWCVTDTLEPGDYSLRLALRTADGDLLGENDYQVAVLRSSGVFCMEF